MNNKKKILKIIFTILSVALFVGLIIYLFPTMKGITTSEGRLKFQQKLDGMGMGKFWVLLALQFAQILLVVLPGEPLEVLAGMCYGTVGGTIFILATVFITTTLIFYLVKKYGKCNDDFIFNSRNTKRFASVFGRIITNQTVEVHININICKISISNIINNSWFKNNGW